MVKVRGSKIWSNVVEDEGYRGVGFEGFESRVHGLAYGRDSDLEPSPRTGTPGLP